MNPIQDPYQEEWSYIVDILYKPTISFISFQTKKHPNPDLPSRPSHVMQQINYFSKTLLLNTI